MNIESHQEEVQDLAAPSTCRRIGAALIDFALAPILYCITYVVLANAVYQDHHPHYDIPPLVDTWITWIFLFLVPLGIESPTTALFGRSFGKCVFGIKVVVRRADSKVKTRAFFRTLVKWAYFIFGIYLPAALDSGTLSRNHTYPWWIYGEWTSFIKSVAQAEGFGYAVLVLNIVMVVLILGLHRKDRLGVYDQMIGTRLVRSDC